MIGTRCISTGSACLDNRWSPSTGLRGTFVGVRSDARRPRDQQRLAESLGLDGRKTDTSRKFWDSSSLLV